MNMLDFLYYCNGNSEIGNKKRIEGFICAEYVDLKVRFPNLKKY